jgi:hypothetical protein
VDTYIWKTLQRSSHHRAHFNDTAAQQQPLKGDDDNNLDLILREASSFLLSKFLSYLAFDKLSDYSCPAQTVDGIPQ